MLYYSWSIWTRMQWGGSKMFYSIKFLVSFIDLNVLVVFIKLLYSSHLACFIPTSKNCLHRNTRIYLSPQLQVDAISVNRCIFQIHFHCLSHLGWDHPLCEDLPSVQWELVRLTSWDYVGRLWSVDILSVAAMVKNGGRDKYCMNFFLSVDVSFQNVCYNLNNHRVKYLLRDQG